MGSATPNPYGQPPRDYLPPPAPGPMRSGRSSAVVDDVVTSVADNPVASPTDLIVRVRSHRPGDEISLEVRGRGPVSVTLGSKVG